MGFGKASTSVMKVPLQKSAAGLLVYSESSNASSKHGLPLVKLRKGVGAKVDMVDSQNGGGAQYRPQNTMILIIGTAEKTRI